LIKDESLRSELEATWKEVCQQRESLKTSVLANFAGLPSRRAGDYAYNLVFVLAYGALQEILTELERQGVFRSRRYGLKALFEASRGKLPWVNFEFVDKGRCLRNKIAHGGFLIDTKDCWAFIDAIEHELNAWQILTFPVSDSSDH